MRKTSLGKRIAIFGSGGKTTLASALARKMDVPHIELDAIAWLPNWQLRPWDEFGQLVEQRLDESLEGWVTDGNYSRIRPLILSRADTIVVIQLPFRQMYWRILKRTIRRTWKREVLWNGNRENWRNSFASRDSILIEMLQKRERYVSYGETIPPEAPSGATVIVLRSSAGLDDFYETYCLEREDRSLQTSSSP